MDDEAATAKGLPRSGALLWQTAFSKVKYNVRAASVDLSDQAIQTTIRLTDLPPHVAAGLAEFDKDGDGLLSVEEILIKGAEMEHLRNKARPSTLSPVAPNNAEPHRRYFSTPSAMYADAPNSFARRPSIIVSCSSSCQLRSLRSWLPLSASWLAWCSTRASLWCHVVLLRSPQWMARR